MMKYFVFVSFLVSATLGVPLGASTSDADNCNAHAPLHIRAPARVKATTVNQSISNWIEDVNTVNSFLNVALTLPIGAPLQSGASNALAFANDEPVNLKFLMATPGMDEAGLSAAGVLQNVFGNVLTDLGNVVNQPLSLPVAINAVSQINKNRYTHHTIFSHS